MTNKQALELVVSACGTVLGNRAQHEALSQALAMLAKLVPTEVAAPVPASAPDNVVDIKS